MCFDILTKYQCGHPAGPPVRQEQPCAARVALAGLDLNTTINPNPNPNPSPRAPPLPHSREYARLAALCYSGKAIRVLDAPCRVCEMWMSVEEIGVAVTCEGRRSGVTGEAIGKAAASIGEEGDLEGGG